MKPDALMIDSSMNMTAGLFVHDTLWMIEPTVGFRIWEQLKGENLARHAAEFEIARQATEAAAAAGKSGDGQPPKPFQMTEDGIGLFSLSGPMTKRATSFSAGTSTVMLARQIDLARRDKDVLAGAMIADTPGGSVAGTAFLADTLARFAAEKPFYVFVEDQLNSAGLWVGSQATAIYSNRTALHGSFGTVMALMDMSRAAANLGIEVLVFATGEFKAAGTPGTEVTKEQRSYFQGIVDSLQQDFAEAVQRGRGLTPEQMAEIKSARVYKAPRALELGLLDKIGGFDTMMDELRQSISDTQYQKKRKTLMDARILLGSAAPAALGDAVPEAESDPGLNPLLLPDAQAPDDPPSQTAEGTQEKPIMRNLFGAAFAKIGLMAIALGIMSAKSDEPEDVAAAALEGFRAEAEKLAAENPLLKACAAAGINTPEDLAKTTAHAALGQEAESRLRTEAKAMAVVAFGAEATEAIANATKAVDEATSVAAVNSLMSSWELTARAKGLISESGAAAVRQTSPLPLGNHAQDVNEQKPAAGPDAQAIYAKRAKTVGSAV